MDSRCSCKGMNCAVEEELDPVSPDVRWIAYQSNESGRSEIYVRPFPDVNGGRWQVSTAGGVQAIWSRQTHELFYPDGEGYVTAVPVQTQPTFSAGRPMRVFETRYAGGGGARTYDVSPDGSRFLMLKETAVSGSAARPATIGVVMNWQEELKRLLPPK